MIMQNEYLAPNYEILRSLFWDKIKLTFCS